MSAFESYSIKYVPLYDAIDTIPWNGQIDEYDVTFYSDAAHPNTAGHAAMGTLLGYFIFGWDYNETYYPTNDTLIVTADYNQTIYINNSNYNFDTNLLTVTCINNNTYIPYTINIAMYGSEMIHFDVVKGNNYNLNDKFEIKTINSQANNSVTYASIYSFVWSKYDGAEFYQLQIANDSNFNNILVELSYINELNYPVYYTENSTSIEFILPEQYRQTKQCNYYIRARPCYL
jgi:hypothetical protein